MRRCYLFLIYLLLPLVSLISQNREQKDKKDILEIIKKQSFEWSNNNLEGFMEGYWKNDSLKFYGSSGLTKGWQKILENYKKRYPTKTHSGALTFSIDDISKIQKKSYWVMGRYFLKRSIGDAQGHFLIIFKKIKGQWKIIADMSS